MILLAQATQSSPLAALLPFLLVGAALYFIMIRPQKKRMQQQQSLLGRLEVGDEVLTIGGIFGVIRHIDEEGDEMTIEVAPGNTLRIVKSAVARTVAVDDEADDAADDAADDDEPWSAEGSEADTDSDGSEAGEDK
jgi:preprotein translocase subunit YajC